MNSNVSTSLRMAAINTVLDLKKDDAFCANRGFIDCVEEVYQWLMQDYEVEETATATLHTVN